MSPFYGAEQDVELPEFALLSTSPEFLNAELYTDIAKELLHRFEQNGLIDYLNRAIATMEHAITCIAEDDFYHGAMLRGLGYALQRRFATSRKWHFSG
jgi:hypothetical protein